MKILEKYTVEVKIRIQFSTIYDFDKSTDDVTRFFEIVLKSVALFLYVPKPNENWRQFWIFNGDLEWRNRPKAAKKRVFHTAPFFRPIFHFQFKNWGLVGNLEKTPWVSFFIPGHIYENWCQSWVGWGDQVVFYWFKFILWQIYDWKLFFLSLDFVQVLLAYESMAWNQFLT